MAECSVEFCRSPSRGLGLCNTHYKRLKKFGSPFKTKSTPKGDAQKFYRDVVLTYEGDACLIWPYTRNDGYGALKRDGQMGLVSRFICEDLYGPPPEPDWQAAHYCGRGADGCVTSICGGHQGLKTRWTLSFTGRIGGESVTLTPS